MNKLFHTTKSGTLLLLGVTLLMATGSIALAAIVSDVRATQHNLSAAAAGSASRTGNNVPARTVMATTETQVCVFCHTPHASLAGGIVAPLWNRSLSSVTYTAYGSGSTDAIPSPNVDPGAGTKVCLSCHDGTMAIGMVGVLDAKPNVSIAMSGTGGGGVMPDGLTPNTGFTRNLGIELGNDHPVSFGYEDSLANPLVTNDGELRLPPVVVASTTIVGNRSPGVKPHLPLENNQMECTTCHDPHLYDTDASTATPPPPLKFLRGNRFQLSPPTGAYDPTTDIMCLACHDKDKAGGLPWSGSAHANQKVSTHAYNTADAALREFKDAAPVWQVSCLNCHDTHSVTGSRHLLREGTDDTTSPAKSGGNPAIEETCFQCHSASGIITPLSTVPDIQSDFALAYHMPITNTDQKVTEAHDIGRNFNDTATGGFNCLAGNQCGKDFVESQTALGRDTVSPYIALAKRHAECSDCHNSHRVTKTRLFNDDVSLAATPALAGTHKHSIAMGDTLPHSNLASGSLRGSTGVEPIYSSAEFGANPSAFAAKRGVPPTLGSTLASASYLTREYQNCIECHSNYAYDSFSLYGGSYGPPISKVIFPVEFELGYFGGSTAKTTNGMNYYSDVAMEFQAPASHQGNAAPGDSGATYTTNNQRSWHPVMNFTGRDPVARNIIGSENLWRAPWNGSDVDGAGNTIYVAAVGNQTMNCSDCHGSGNTLADGSEPSNQAGGEDGNPWGPHGSDNAFLLKGPWSTVPIVSVTPTSDMLCFRCHDGYQYADATATVASAPVTILPSGFGGPGTDTIAPGGQPLTNMHQRHAYYATTGAGTWPAGEVYRCTLCHTGTAHGWKNKDFLVNLNDLGLELNAGYGAIGGETAPGPVVLAAGVTVPKGTVAPAGYTNGPFYQGAYLRISTTFAASGNWVKTDCAGSCH